MLSEKGWIAQGAVLRDQAANNAVFPPDYAGAYRKSLRQMDGIGER
jgi:hypothetical protein